MAILGQKSEKNDTRFKAFDQAKTHRCPHFAAPAAMA